MPKGLFVLNELAHIARRGEALKAGAGKARVAIPAAPLRAKALKVQLG